MKKPIYETVKCRWCGREFRRQSNVSRRAQSCGATRCRKIAALNRNPGKPVGFDGLPNTPSEYRADIDYHGCVPRD